jgi:hypothetical protein
VFAAAARFRPQTHGSRFTVLVALLFCLTACTQRAPVAKSHEAPRTLHYAANAHGAITAAAALGFDLFDIDGSGAGLGALSERIDSLPARGKALVWVGNLDNAPPGSSCPAPGLSFGRFKAVVDALRHDRRVYGYYLADEPHPDVCPEAAADIRARADLVHAVAPRQKAFIVVADGSAICRGNLGCEYRALRPAKTHVDLVGLDPYPCHYDKSGNPVPCESSMISARVAAAIASGIPATSIVPVFQAFGQSGRDDGKSIYYRMPTANELASMLRVWHGLVPEPAFDYFYSVGVQCSTASCPAPQAILSTPGIMPTVRGHNED